MSSLLPSVFNKYKIPITIIAIFLLVLGVAAYFWASKNVYFRDGQIKTGNVIARVKGVAITDEDLVKFDKIYNALVKYQKQLDPKVEVPSREETLQALKEKIVIDIEAKSKKLVVSAEEIKNRNKSFNPAIYGLNEQEAEELAKLNITREKVQQALLTWKEAEFISLRFDVLPETHAPLTLDQWKGKAKEFFEIVKERFSKGEEVIELGKVLATNSEVLKYFPANAVQVKKMPEDKMQRQLNQITPQSNFPVEKHILKLKVGTNSEVWCSDTNDACYMIRVLAGNDGYEGTFKEWLKEQLK